MILQVPVKKGTTEKLVADETLSSCGFFANNFTQSLEGWVITRVTICLH